MTISHRSVLQAARICKNLFSRIAQKPLQTVVHSVYESSINLLAEEGLVTLLEERRKLQPYSAVLTARDFELLKNRAKLTGTVFLIAEKEQNAINGIGPAVIPIEITDHTQVVDLTVPCFNRAADAGRIQSFLKSKSDSYGISALAYQEMPNEFCRFLQPRLHAFRNAVLSGSIEKTADAAAKISGCGVGLTPSSDDLICGYCAALSASGAPRDLVYAITFSAAQRTNEISASLLQRAGEGLASEPVLNLLSALYGSSQEQTDECISKAAKLGGSSGLDILTGVYFGMTDAALHWRGKFDQA